MSLQESIRKRRELKAELDNVEKEISETQIALDKINKEMQSERI